MLSHGPWRASPLSDNPCTTRRREQGHSGGWSSFLWLLVEVMAGREWEVWYPGVGGSAGWPEPACGEIRSKGGRLSVWAQSACSPRSLRGDSRDVDLEQRCFWGSKLSGLTAGRSPLGCRSGESLMGQGQVSFLRACRILSPELALGSEDQCRCGRAGSWPAGVIKSEQWRVSQAREAGERPKSVCSSRGTGSSRCSGVPGSSWSLALPFACCGPSGESLS